jgi:hypothetical protein
MPSVFNYIFSFILRKSSMQTDRSNCPHSKSEKVKLQEFKSAHCGSSPQLFDGSREHHEPDPRLPGRRMLPYHVNFIWTSSGGFRAVNPFSLVSSWLLADSHVVRSSGACGEFKSCFYCFLTEFGQLAEYFIFSISLSLFFWTVWATKAEHHRSSWGGMKC